MRVLLLRHPGFSGEPPGAWDMLLISYHFPKGVAFPFTQSWLGKKSLPIIQTSAGRSQGKKPHVTREGGPRARENCVRVCVPSVCVTDRAF